MTDKVLILIIIFLLFISFYLLYLVYNIEKELSNHRELILYLYWKLKKLDWKNENKNSYKNEDIYTEIKELLKSMKKGEHYETDTENI